MPKKRGETAGAAVYVGSYTIGGAGRGEGIHVYRLEASGKLEFERVVRGVVNPSFLAFDAHFRRLYAVNEVEGIDGGAVSVFALDPLTGEPVPLNRRSSRGSLPCHLIIDRAGRFVLTANYGSGSVAVLPICEDGRLGDAVDVVHHRGSGVNPSRQEGPHPHSVTFDPGGRFLFAADLGLDALMAYRLDGRCGRLYPRPEAEVRTPPGSGPRHMAFHPGGRYAYVIHELDSTVGVFSYNPALGQLTRLQTLSTLPPGFQGQNSCAEVKVSPSGKFLYASNRGHDSISIFSVNTGTGRLAAMGHELTRGRTPRGFIIDPTGSLLLVANQDTGSVVSFHIDSRSGSLTPTGHEAQVPAPVCPIIKPRIMS
jgi:6-phosphogluconolactonase